jgi:hypothetical protein
MENIFLVIFISILYIPQIILTGYVIGSTVSEISLYMTFWERLRNVLIAILFGIIFLIPVTGTLLVYYVYNNCDEIPLNYRKAVNYFYILYSWTIIIALFLTTKI